LALADQLQFPMIVKRGWSGFPVIKDALYNKSMALAFQAIRYLLISKLAQMLA